MKRYIHYGHKHFDKNLFMNIHNSMFTKPNGGLWASDIKSKYSWKNGAKKIISENVMKIVHLYFNYQKKQRS